MLGTTVAVVTTVHGVRGWVGAGRWKHHILCEGCYVASVHCIGRRIWVCLWVHLRSTA